MNKKMDRETELRKLQSAEWPGQFEVKPDNYGVVVLAVLHKPTPYTGKYHATFRHPGHGRYVLGQVSEQEVFAAMARQVKAGVHA